MMNPDIFEPEAARSGLAALIPRQPHPLVCFGCLLGSPGSPTTALTGASHGLGRGKLRTMLEEVEVKKRARLIRQKKARGRPPGLVSLDKHPLRFDVVIFELVRPIVANDIDAAELTISFGDERSDLTWISRLVDGEPWPGFSSEYRGGYGEEIGPAPIVNGKAVKKYKPGNRSARLYRRDRILRQGRRLIEVAQKEGGPALAWLEESKAGLKALLTSLATGNVELKGPEILVAVDPGWLDKVEHLERGLSRIASVTP
jgi:hypothetical protein